MTLLTARCSPSGVWAVTPGRSMPPGRPFDQRLQSEVSHKFPACDVWKLELAKTRRALSVDDLALVRSFCAAALERPEVPLELEVPDPAVWRRAILNELRRSGARTEAVRHVNMGARYLSASLAAFAALAATALRVAGEQEDTLQDGEVIAAVHGEKSNRTRHVLAEAARAGVCPSLIVLGRPRKTLQEFRKTVVELGLDHAPCVRPYRARDIRAAAMQALPRLREGWQSLSEHEGNPTTSELARVVYRVLLGDAMQRWQRTAGPKAEGVIYGHTGLADTTSLERAQQESGTPTQHYVHGVTSGYHWVGVSNVAVFKCEHDARWHRRLGGYAQSVAFVAPQPSFQSEGDGVLLLSNLIHPMNEQYQKEGPKGELELFRLVSSALDQSGLNIRRRVWKPHPIFDAQPAEVRETVEATAAASGFERWPHDAPLSRAASYRFIVTTPSTVALDVLRLGKLPIIAEVEDIPAGAAVSSFPLRGHSSAELAAALCEAADPERSALLFEDTWTRIGPSREPSWKELTALLENTTSRAMNEEV